MLPFARWLVEAPESWRLYTLLASRYQPVKTLIRGRPWEDTQ